MELPPTAALDFPNVEALAGFVVQRVAPAASGQLVGLAGSFDVDDSYWSDLSGEAWGSQVPLWLSLCAAPASLTCLMCALLPHSDNDDTATEIVGLSCAYPGPAAASSVMGFWQAAAGGADLPTVIPHDRWAIEQHYSPDVTGWLGDWQAAPMPCPVASCVQHGYMQTPALLAVEKMYVRFAGFLPAADTFDAALFRYATVDGGRCAIELACKLPQMP